MESRHATLTSLLPKEHGAYGQMVFPLVTVVAVAGMNAPTALALLAIVAGFLAHEPLLILLGMRGPRARRHLQRVSGWWFATAATVAVAAGSAAMWTIPGALRWSFAVPLVPAVLLVLAIASRREKTWYAELAVALAFSLAAVPVCLAAGGARSTAWAIATSFGVIFVTGTLAVRVVILKVRGGGDPRETAVTRVAALTSTLVGAVALAAGAATALLPWSAPVAAAPGLVIAAAVALFPPPPARLRTLGWRLVAASLLAALVIGGAQQ